MNIIETINELYYEKTFTAIRTLLSSITVLIIMGCTTTKLFSREDILDAQLVESFDQLKAGNTTAYFFITVKDFLRQAKPTSEATFYIDSDLLKRDGKSVENEPEVVLFRFCNVMKERNRKFKSNIEIKVFVDSDLVADITESEHDLFWCRAYEKEGAPPHIPAMDGNLVRLRDLFKLYCDLCPFTQIVRQGENRFFIMAREGALPQGGDHKKVMAVILDATVWNGKETSSKYAEKKLQYPFKWNWSMTGPEVNRQPQESLLKDPFEGGLHILR
jgi:hypothetical protein